MRAEDAKREAKTIELRMTLDNADAAKKRGDLNGAAQDIPPGREPGS